MTALWNFIASNYGFLFCVWAFVGHIYWIKSGAPIDFSRIRYPSKKEMIFLELAGLPIFWASGPLTPLYRYAILRPGNAMTSAVFYRDD